MTTIYNFMLIPSNSCQANCNYCFGPQSGPVMQENIAVKTIRWITNITEASNKISITFHGGEPLLAGIRWYQNILTMLRDTFGNKLKLGIQSNLWLINDKYSRLFSENEVVIGTSLDGYEYINDVNRGKGNFSKTMHGIELAIKNNLNVGIVCTFTPQSYKQCKDIIDFFITQNLDVNIHGAVPAFNKNHNQYVLDQIQHETLFTSLFEYYLCKKPSIAISPFDTMIRSVGSGIGGVCTFHNCLGRYLCIAADGGIFPCNRFVLKQDWCMGYVQNNPSIYDLQQSKPWRKLSELQSSILTNCGGCQHLQYCNGGCLYNAVINGSLKQDPFCKTYKTIFDKIVNRSLSDFFSDKNIHSIIEKGYSKYQLVNENYFFQILHGRRYKQSLLSSSRRVVAAVAIAVTNSPEEAFDKLNSAGIITKPKEALESLSHLFSKLNKHQTALNNAYLHITYGCNLQCSYCYASSGPDKVNKHMAVNSIVLSANKCIMSNFRNVIITGGEPLTHPQWHLLLNELINIRNSIDRISKLTLRTNLSLQLCKSEINYIANCTDTIVVSIDGNKMLHDACRGNGSYELTLYNLNQLISIKSKDDVILSGTFSPQQIRIGASDILWELGHRLGLKTRIKPILPLGRAIDLKAELSIASDLIDDYYNYTGPLITCGLGSNLYIAPNGNCYPCYATVNSNNYLGNIIQNSIEDILVLNQHLSENNFSNSKCKECKLRFICGGYCQAWVSDYNQNNISYDCSYLHNKAVKIYLQAIDILSINKSKLMAVGLPVYT